MSELDLGAVADQFVAQYNEILKQCAWLKVKPAYLCFLKERDLLMLGMKAAMVHFVDRLRGSQEYLLTSDGEDEFAQFTVQDDFSATGLSLFIEVDWDFLFSDPGAWGQMLQFYDILLLGLAIAAQWGSDDDDDVPSDGQCLANNPSVLKACEVTDTAAAAAAGTLED